MTVNQRIKELFDEKKYSPNYVAKRLKADRKTILSYSEGHTNPSYKFLLWLFNEYPKLNVKWLFFGEGEKYLSFKENEDHEKRILELENWKRSKRLEDIGRDQLLEKFENVINKLEKGLK